MKNLIRIILLCGALAVQFSLSGCGGGGGGAGGVVQGSEVAAPTSLANKVTPVNSYSLSLDQLGLLTADTFLTESTNTGGFVMRAADAARMVNGSSEGDVFRIDITDQTQITTGVSYPIGLNSNSPCAIVFPDGENTSLPTTSGSITFSSFGTHNGDVVAGVFDVKVGDTYEETGSFQFVLNN
ncbi:MAG TPA: hypothetical protein VMJ66_17555 [Geobacteraceae bacterium]|nr:hypothetical protein [Geobacteraceae bacterium]